MKAPKMTNKLLNSVPIFCCAYVMKTLMSFFFLLLLFLSFCYSDRLSLSHKITRNQYTDNTFQKNELQKNEKNNYLQQSGWEAIACDSATAC